MRAGSTTHEEVGAMSLMDCGKELFDAQLGYKACRPALGCLPEFQDGLIERLGMCKIEFWKVCDFDDLMRICPFDPAWDAFDWKQQVVSERLQTLEVQVKELQAKLPTLK